MNPRVKPADDLKMNAAEFDTIMRGALQAPASKKKPQKGSRAKNQLKSSAKQPTHQQL